MKFVALPKDVQEALSGRGFDPAGVGSLSAEEVFREYCLWHGLLGSWHSDLWEITALLRKQEGIEKHAG